MKYHAPSKQFTLDQQALEGAALNIRYALKKIRDLAGLPHDKYKREGPLTDACFAQLSLLEAAENLGIDMGVTRHAFHELDLRDAT